MNFCSVYTLRSLDSNIRSLPSAPEFYYFAHSSVSFFQSQPHNRSLKNFYYHLNPCRSFMSIHCALHHQLWMLGMSIWRAEKDVRMKSERLKCHSRWWNEPINIGHGSAFLGCSYMQNGVSLIVNYIYLEIIDTLVQLKHLCKSTVPFYFNHIFIVVLFFFIFQFIYFMLFLCFFLLLSLVEQI